MGMPISLSFQRRQNVWVGFWGTLLMVYFFANFALFGGSWYGDRQNVASMKKSTTSFSSLDHGVVTSTASPYKESLMMIVGEDDDPKTAMKGGEDPSQRPETALRSRHEPEQRKPKIRENYVEDKSTESSHLAIEMNDLSKMEIQTSDDNNVGGGKENEPSILIGLSHHKTGTYQMSCLLENIAAATGINIPQGDCIKDHGTTANDIISCLNMVPDQIYPAIFKTYHGVTHRCRAKGREYIPCVSFMLYRQCKKEEIIYLLKGDQSCEIDLPQWEVNKQRLAVLHFIRNPIDIIVSAYSFHISAPTSEPWLFKPRSLERYINELTWIGTPLETLKYLNLTEENQFQGENMLEISYLELLENLSLKQGVIMQFWHSLPELVTMVRQSKSLQSQFSDANIELKFEDLKQHFNKTVREAIEKANYGRLQEHPIADLLDAVVIGQCDPGTWSNKQIQKSSHVTSGKVNTEEIEAALMTYPAARSMLCALSLSLGYSEDDRCHDWNSPPGCSYNNLESCIGAN